MLRHVSSGDLVTGNVVAEGRPRASAARRWIAALMRIALFGAALQIVLIATSIAGFLPRSLDTYTRDETTRALLMVRPGFECLVVPPSELTVELAAESEVDVAAESATPTASEQPAGSSPRHRGPNFAALSWAIDLAEMGPPRADLTDAILSARRRLPESRGDSVEASPYAFVYSVGAGWPLICLTGAAIGDSGAQAPSARWTRAWCLVIEWSRGWPHIAFIPLRIHTLALIVNIAVLGLVGLAASGGARRLRAAYRRRRGLCAACGYSMGMDAPSVCPECGARRG